MLRVIKRKKEKKEAKNSSPDDRRPSLRRGRRGTIDHRGHHKYIAFGEIQPGAVLVGRSREVRRLVLQAARRGYGRRDGHEQGAGFRRLLKAVRP